MPYPSKGESKPEYTKRFMGSPEANKDFSDPAQRYAVAMSMWKDRKNDADIPARAKTYKCSWIQPGLVFYSDLGPEGETVLVDDECIAKMAPSFVGTPVIDSEHKDVSTSTIPDGEADGIVTRVWKDEKSSYWMAEFIVWSKACQEHCESPAFSVSCAYEPTEVDSSGGTHNNLPYQQKILNGQLTHLAVVTNPRYEGCRIFVNSKSNSRGEKIMSLLKFWNKGGRKNAADLDPEKMIDLGDGKQAPLKNLIAAAESEEKKKEDSMLNDDDIVQMPSGKEKTVKELKAAYAASLAKGEEKEEKDNSHLEGHPEKHAEKTKADLPDLRHASDADLRNELKRRNQKDNPDEAEGNAMKNEESHDREDDAEKNAHKDGHLMEEKLELEQDGDSKGRLPEEAKKAGESFEAKPEGKLLTAKGDEKASKRAEEEMESALVEGEDTKKLLSNRREAGKKSFADLRNAATERYGDPVRPSIVTREERLARGKDKYGKV